MKIYAWADVFKLQGGQHESNVFICQNFACQAPVQDVARVKDLLQHSSGSRETAKPTHMDVSMLSKPKAGQ